MEMKKRVMKEQQNTNKYKIQNTTKAKRERETLETLIKRLILNSCLIRLHLGTFWGHKKNDQIDQLLHQTVITISVCDIASRTILKNRPRHKSPVMNHEKSQFSLSDWSATGQRLTRSDSRVAEEQLLLCLINLYSGLAQSFGNVVALKVWLFG